MTKPGKNDKPSNCELIFCNTRNPKIQWDFYQGNQGWPTKIHHHFSALCKLSIPKQICYIVDFKILTKVLSHSHF